jgi:hypothetical protein
MMDPHGTVYSPDHLKETASMIVLVKEIAAQLMKHYPGWRWAIQPDPRGGVVSIFNHDLSGEWGMILKLEWLQASPSSCKQHVLAAGAELLERYSLPAGAYNHERWLNAPRDVAGNLRPDVSDKLQRIQKKFLPAMR